MRITIVGDGGWGTALGVLLARNGHNTTLWGAFPEYLKIMIRAGENKKFLPGVQLPAQMKIEPDLARALDESELVVFAVPAQFLRIILKKVKAYCSPGCLYLSVVKGLEFDSAKRMSELIREILGTHLKLAVLSGPNIASEVVCGIPSACVVAAKNINIARKIQKTFMTESFRVYTAQDLIGVELGGALKNVIAIACGISDGLGFGTNTKAALLTRGLVEMTKLGAKLGADFRTFTGLSGLGDLVTTSFNPRSRNYSLGEQLGRGKKLAKILTGTEMVIEGVMTAKAALKLARKNRVEMPITNEVCAVLFKNKSPFVAVKCLMQRSGKREM
ncbi:MAG: NAD(P)-dependent glycerol-3-phosphate dehydrogenase [Candidatus Omnitrophica bacterium]|nr:NAD(P)-dependent glycerol-3-phosphate dehydrogenase [Candidatus Omnitrophota bacterium]MBU1925549.1 NAD(P)-dependent glycerol-3-phosphate dehydrogenase [Candidatus Omnitrophota bacterium]